MNAHLIEANEVQRCTGTPETFQAPPRHSPLVCQGLGLAVCHLCQRPARTTTLDNSD